MSVFPAYMSVHHVHAVLTKARGPIIVPELELQMTMSLHVGANSQIWIISKSSQGS